MAKIPPLKRLLKEDFKGVPWIEALLQPLNTFMEAIVSAFNKNITIDNIKANIITFTYSNSTSVTTRFKAGIGIAPKVMMVGNVSPLDTATLSGPVFFTWTYLPDSDQIEIQNSYGLATTNGKYYITVLIFGD
jgi:hypothetical protein